MKNHLSLIFHLSVFIFPFAVFNFPLASQEVQFSGEAGSLWATAVRSENRGDFVLGDNYIKGKFEAFYGNSSAFAEGRTGFDSLENKAYAEVREIYVDYTTDCWGIRVGRQKTAWGKADGINITNLVCPKDYSSARTLFENEYLAVDASRISINSENLSADFYYIPFFTPAALSEETKSQLSTLTEPDLTFSSAEYALKLSGYFSSLDLSLYGFYGWEDMPFLDYRISSERVQVAANYKKVLMMGADAAIPLGETVLRLEGAFFPKRHFQTAAEKILSGGEYTEEHNNFSGLAGLDWMREGWTFTAQYFFDCLFGERENLERGRKFEHGSTLSISKKFFSERLELSASAVLMLKDFDTFIKAHAEYSLTDSLYLKAGGYIFNRGKEKGSYGQYEDYTSVYIKARYVF